MKKLYGRLPLKGIPRINQIKDISTYGVRQYIIVDPSGNYLRIGQPIPKTDSVLFDENGKKPQKGTALTRAYEQAERYAYGKDDLEAAIKVIDKVLTKETDLKELPTLFRLITLRLDIAHTMDELETMKQLIEEGTKVLSQIDESNFLNEDIANFRRISSDIKK